MSPKTITQEQLLWKTIWQALRCKDTAGQWKSLLDEMERQTRIDLNADRKDADKHAKLVTGLDKIFYVDESQYKPVALPDVIPELAGKVPHTGNINAEFLGLDQNIDKAFKILGAILITNITARRLADVRKDSKSGLRINAGLDRHVKMWIGNLLSFLKDLRSKAGDRGGPLKRAIEGIKWEKAVQDFKDAGVPGAFEEFMAALVGSDDIHAINPKRLVALDDLGKRKQAFLRLRELKDLVVQAYKEQFGKGSISSG